MSNPDGAQMLGRYEIIGSLASGGMAELFLAKLQGLDGFARLVAIKRILPRWARDPAFVKMFCDEARTVARIRHPNVVQVHELGQNEDELFLVMEYLEGESVSGLQRRLHLAGSHLSPLEVCFVIAEACRGLDAAHDLTDDDDLPLHIVHRDVSPQNLFVTYDGIVKVIDFGIAKASDRQSSTHPQAVKGKLAYMAPEQYAGKSLDRRADVFAIGVVMHELLTGHLLFAREQPADTMIALLEAPIVAPSSVAPWVPGALDEICLRALARNRHERYASCAEMRRDLLQVMPSIGSVGTAQDELAARMRSLYGDRIVEKRDLIRRARLGSTAQVPAGEADRTVIVPTIEAAALYARAREMAQAAERALQGGFAHAPRAATTPALEAHEIHVRRPMSRARWAVVALAAGGALGTLTVALRPDAAPIPASAPEPTPSSARVEPANEIPSATVEPAHSASASSAATTVARATAAPPSPPRRSPPGRLAPTLPTPPTTAVTPAPTAPTTSAPAQRPTLIPL